MILLSRFKISGHSMEPTLKNREQILVSAIPYFFRKPQKGDVVLVKFENKKLVKRIDSIKGERYLVVGDNKKDSLDGRVFGEVTRADILAKLIYRLS